MKILLAQAELYQSWLDRGLARFTSFDGDAMEAGMASDMSEFQMTTGGDAIIQVAGPLAYKYDFWSWLMDGSSYQGIMAKIAAAEGNPDVKRVVFLMDTPGGEVTGVREAAAAIAGMKKPTVAMVDPCCASAGLWLASQAKRIVSTTSGEIGSLGVQCMAISYAEYFKENGLDVRLFRAKISPDKNLAHPYEPIGDKAEEYLQGRVDQFGEMFVSAVASGRGVTSEEVLANYGQGKMLTAEEAVDAGLIDGIMSLGALLAESRTQPMTVGNRATRTRGSSAGMY